MTIKELANELNTLIEAGYGDAKAIISIPTLYVSEDGDVEKNYYRHETEDIRFSAKDYIKGSPDTRILEIPLLDASYDVCDYIDYRDDRRECEGEDDEDDEEWTED